MAQTSWRPTSPSSTATPTAPAPPACPPSSPVTGVSMVSHSTFTPPYNKEMFKTDLMLFMRPALDLLCMLYFY